MRLWHSMLAKMMVPRWNPSFPTTDGNKSPEAWWKAWDIVGLSDGDLISSVSDATGNGHTAEASSGARPTYKKNVQNALPVIRLAGASSNYLTLASAITGSRTWTCFAVFGIASSSAKFPLLVGNGGNDSPYAVFPFSDGNVYSRAYATSNINAHAASTSGWQQITSSDNTGLSMRRNGTDLTLTAGSAPGNSAYPFVFIGRRDADYATGDLLELIIYTSALSTADKQPVESYQKRKAGL